MQICSENSVDSGQLASKKPADLDLHCFQNQIFLGLAGLGVIRLEKQEVPPTTMR